MAVHLVHDPDAGDQWVDDNGNQVAPPSQDQISRSTDGGNTVSTNTNSDGSAPTADVFAGTSYGGDANVGGTDVAGAVNDKDPRDFMYGRDPNYVANTAASERANAANAAQSLQGQANAAQQSGAAMGAQIGQYGVNAGNAVGGYGMQAAGGLTAAGQGAVNAGAAAAGRTGPTANYDAANRSYYESSLRADQLANMQQGPSAAQAQLQSGLNQAQASNLALARSGHGFGASASALSQAAGQNAAMGQQAANTSAQLSAQETQAWNAQHAQNLGAAAGINTAVGGQAQQQGLSQAQLQAQTTAQNDQAQAALTGMGLQAQGQAGQLGTQALTSQGQLGLQGETTGAAVTQAGATTGLQGTQAAMGAYTSGEQMAGINESAGQAGDLARENMLVQEHGINAGVAAGNAAAVNSGWGTALQTAGAITGTAITATSDANAKTGIKPLDAGTPPPAAAAPPPPPPANSGPSLAGSAGAAAGGVAGAAIGSAILPGVGTALGGLAGSIGGRLLGNAISDINAKDQVQSLDAVPGAVPLDTTGMGYGQTNMGSTNAGAGNAFSAGRGAASAAAGKAADADLKAQAKQAAIGSMIGDMGKAAGTFGAGQEAPSLGQFEQLGGMPVAQGYGMQQQPGWGQMQVSDEDEKTGITLADKPPPPPPPDPKDRPLLKRPHPKWAEGWGSAPVTSDEDEKSGVHSSSAALDMVDAAPGYGYEYKDPARHGYGQKFGPMAQDLLRTPAGASTVERTPDGTLAVNTGRLALVEHAALHSDRQQNAARFKQLHDEIEMIKSQRAS